MKIIAKGPDLDLDVTLLDGTQKMFPGPKNLSAEQSLAMHKKWVEYDRPFYYGKDDKGTPMSREADAVLDHEDAKLCEIYGQKQGFFKKNLDFPTVLEIKNYLISELSRAKKN